MLLARGSDRVITRLLSHQEYIHLYTPLALTQNIAALATHQDIAHCSGIACAYHAAMTRSIKVFSALGMGLVYKACLLKMDSHELVLQSAPSEQFLF
jgi:hypothetical protein